MVTRAFVTLSMQSILHTFITEIGVRSVTEVNSFQLNIPITTVTIKQCLVHGKCFG